ncbi:Voltage-dependent T-type calcium channel subunit alpha-1H [Durusdinium trenchii]|uniref:Voltage-dependent T-type calcium channel subunit alpha-1H n=1 Tax=Durusdinium trenchii TaxID=1381693 RepID=A0ABP0JMY9_9DINO
MVASTDRVRAWFELAKSCMSDSDWKVAATIPNASLSHREWGEQGIRLIRFDLRNVFVKDAPEKPCELFVRPEVRAQYGHSVWKEKEDATMQWQQTLAPGDGILEHLSRPMTSFRYGSVLFGNYAGPFSSTFFYSLQPTLTRSRLRRDFPKTGDCAYAAFQDVHGTGQDFVMIGRSEGEPNRFRVVLTFSTPDEQWASWASPFFTTLLGMVQQASTRFLNRPGIADLRQLDQKMYITLGLRNYHRGPPMIPEHIGAEKGQEDVTISGGQELGLAFWKRWLVSGADGKFRLAEYLQRFLQQLGHNVPVHETLDGRRLVPYQCVMLRQDWEHVRASCLEAFRWQKAAYRRKSGGTSAPSLSIDVAPHFLAYPSSNPVFNLDVPKLVVRNTFIEFEEDILPNTFGATKRSKSCTHCKLNV